MRDDIHKGAPVSRKWQQVIKKCNREADWLSGAAFQAAEVAVHELAGELSPRFVRKVETMLSDQQFGMFATEDRLEALRSDLALSALENMVLDFLRVTSDSSPEEPLLKALSFALEERVEREHRAIQVHIHGQSPGSWESQNLVSKVRQAAARVDLLKVARDRIAGESPKPFAESPVDWDEDLTRRK
jgi:hypothetical protein